MKRQQGFAIIEVVIAAAVLVVGTLSAVGALDSARILTLVSERHTTLAHRAQQELERVVSLPYAQIALTAAPAHSTAASNPDFYVSGSIFQYDRSDATKTEPLAVDGTNGTITPNSGGCTDGCTAKWSDGSQTGEIFTFITSLTDGASGANCSPGCPTSGDYKRVAVAVTLDGSHTTSPVWVSSYKADPKAAPQGAPANSQQNPLQSPVTTCHDSNGNTVACTNGLSSGTGVTYYETDSSYTGSYSPPCSDNNTHPTITGSTQQDAPVPDQMTTTSPSTCSGSVNPPCFSSDIGCIPGVGGREIVPTSSSGTCTSPPSDNNKSEFWVTPTLSLNTKVTGSGAMTLYTQSANGSAISATLCLQLYLEPPSQLGTTSGLLSQPIGAAVAANVQAYPTSPTPITFNFNTGGNATVSLAGTRVGVAIWLAGSAQNVVLVYDHPSFASSIQLIEQ